MGAHSNLELVLAGYSKRIARFGRDPLEVEAFFPLRSRACGAAGVRGGCRPASCCVFVYHSFRDMHAGFLKVVCPEGVLFKIVKLDRAT